MNRWQYSEINLIMMILNRLLMAFDNVKTSEMERMTGISRQTLVVMWDEAGKAVEILNDLLTAADDDGTPLPRKYAGWTRPGQD
jgi:DNA-binding Xre family transcriptional regulator